MHAVTIRPSRLDGKLRAPSRRLVVFKIDYTEDRREFATLMVDGENVNMACLAAGWVKIRQDSGSRSLSFGCATRA